MTRTTLLNLPTEIQKNFLGFDRWVEEFSNLPTSNTGFPPYNMERFGDTEYQITLAVAGFKREDVSITVNHGLLTIEGNQEEIEPKSDGVFLHKGIAARNFSRQWKLAEYVEVLDAKMTDGMLYIRLEHVVPEEKKPTTIDIH
jgi:molecular chaperone IbpA